MNNHLCSGLALETQVSAILIRADRRQPEFKFVQRCSACYNEHSQTIRRTSMGALSWIVFGFLAGLIAKWLTSGSDPKGCIVTIVIGIVGAAIGGWVGTQLGLGSVSGFDLRSLALAVAGS